MDASVNPILKTRMIKAMSNDELPKTVSTNPEKIMNKHSGICITEAYCEGEKHPITENIPEDKQEIMSPNCYYEVFDHEHGKGTLTVPIYLSSGSPLYFSFESEEHAVLFSTTPESQFVSMRASDSYSANEVISTLEDANSNIHIDVSGSMIFKGLLDLVIFHLNSIGIRIYFTPELMDELEYFDEEDFENWLLPNMLSSLKVTDTIVRLLSPAIRHDGGLVFFLTDKEDKQTVNLDIREFVCSFDIAFSKIFLAHETVYKGFSEALIVVPNQLRQERLEVSLRNEEGLKITVATPNKIETLLLRGNYKTVIFLDITVPIMLEMFSDPDIQRETRNIETVFGVAYGSDEIRQHDYTEFFTLMETCGPVRVVI